MNKDETELCWKIGVKYRKEISVGDWLSFNDCFYLVTEIIKTSEKVDVYATNFGITISADDDFFPLLQISDCLEFLREKGFTIIQACEHPMSHEWIIEINPYGLNGIKIMGNKSFEVKGKDLLEACLKAVLAIVEES